MKKKITFEDLAKIAQTSRNPCGKQAYTLSGAAGAARDRNKFVTGKTYYPTVCFDGCGRNIFHLTTQRPGARVQKIFERGAVHAARVKRERRKASRARARAVICVWEGEGGSYGE
jgi:hypothetical protein